MTDDQPITVKFNGGPFDGKARTLDHLPYHLGYPIQPNELRDVNGEETGLPFVEYQHRYSCGKIGEDGYRRYEYIGIEKAH